MTLSTAIILGVILATMCLIIFGLGLRIATLQEDMDILQNWLEDFEDFRTDALNHMAGIVNMSVTPEKTPGMP